MIEPADQTTSSACFFKSALNQSALPLRQQPINSLHCCQARLSGQQLLSCSYNYMSCTQMAASAPYQDTQMGGVGNFESHQLRSLLVLISQYVKHISVTMLFSIICDKHFSFIHTEYLRESLCQFSLIFSKFHDFFVKLCVKLKKGKAN